MAFPIKKIILFILLLFTSSLVSANLLNWKWKGFEVIGNKKVSRSKILSLIPIKKDSEYKTEIEKWVKWCDIIKERFNFFYTKCSAVRYSDFKAFFVIEIIEKGDEFRLKFRQKPSLSIQLVNSEVLNKFDSLQKRLWGLFDQGISVKEDSSKGYLDYSDDIMSSIVKKLVNKVPLYRSNLWKVIEFDKDAEKRGKAATLLNWALNTNESIEKVYPFLNDRNETVRNNISRFMLHYFDRIDDIELRQSVIKSLSKQLWWPSHGDRNKAIYGLLEIANKHPQDRAYIKTTALNGIHFLHKNSILSNVRGPADKLLKILNAEK